jgi:hypothetical protein
MTIKLPAIYDLAVMHLKTAVTDITPSPICATKPAPGWSVTLVGFGIIQDNQSESLGTKHVGVNTIWGISDQSYNVEGSGGGSSNFCSGDSGGPAFTATSSKGEGIVGVHSATSVPDCKITGIDMRVDLLINWIKKTAKGQDIKTTTCTGKGSNLG